MWIDFPPKRELNREGSEVARASLELGGAFHPGAAEHVTRRGFLVLKLSALNLTVYSPTGSWSSDFDQTCDLQIPNSQPSTLS
jgi:hypothetical protein